MNIHNILIHLQNTVDAFSFKPRHLDQLRQALPHIPITVASDTKDFMERLPEAECVLVWHFKAPWYDKAPKLKMVFTPAAGHDWVDEDPSGRVKTHYGSFHGRIMRESLLSMMLYFNRRMGKSLDDQKNRVWGRLGYNDCTALFRQQVLIVGLGALGESMAELLKAFGAGVTGVKRRVEGFAAPLAVDRVIPFGRLEEALPHADHVVLLLPGGAETDGIFTTRHFDAMKPGACLYNLGRGNCYREEDLLHALHDGPLAGAGLDVFAVEPLAPDSLLWHEPDILITPHSSAISQEYIDLFIEELLEALHQAGFCLEKNHL
ncbi:D-isomer-specific 2-hydroxyacid dehydrogenase, NAD-dependent [Geotalea daltonii FRC-32]|uniref:D-isomer-specific 2-hydroxyacid dehydrogenase, NAD-dependent n=1 Tax=Geotalea daltonii (strain DSM 22248 / JCM 15807 / FRC-32) TaxID=316067 RepID=B9M202_GEODF|nr:D-2-hydroxyacid dehydrogenase [Geotalea daltonii]ACM19298.1 D-isomer-specific 2-hydroxyacid dehydrogenase, NAD-dependent [Geotalea daltonii FRC-32]